MSRYYNVAQVNLSSQFEKIENDKHFTDITPSPMYRYAISDSTTGILLTEQALQSLSVIAISDQW